MGLLIFVLSSIAISARADLIDFETNPAGMTPPDNSTLNDPYALDGGGTIRFFFDMNGDNRFDAGDDLPEFEAVGSDFSNGFVATQVGDLQYDRARPGANGSLGTRFLNNRNGLNSGSGSLVISYDTQQTVTEFSGEIWDIDGEAGQSEQWLIAALDENGNTLLQQLSPEGIDSGPDSLDSLPWGFAFRNLPNTFRAIRFEFVGTKNSSYNLALDNFSATSAVPEPGSTAIIGGCIGVLVFSRKRRRRVMN